MNEALRRSTPVYIANGYPYRLSPGVSPGGVHLGDRSEELIGGPDTPSKVTVSFDLGSRAAVDELVERAGAAGGRIGDTDDYPFMYQRQFDDPDGYHYSPFWMKPDDDQTA